MRLIVCIFIFYSSLLAFDKNSLKKELKSTFESGEFIQIKYIKDFPMTFESSGVFEIRNMKELIWETKQPIQNKIKIDKNGIYNFSKTKWIKEDNKIDIKLFLDMLSLNIENLNNMFDDTLYGNYANWTLELNPKNIIIKKIFDSITIKGSDFIKSVDIKESSGDITHIDFFNQKKINE